jgi:glycosyltransferase involved in cell wall biosynthesis
MTTQRPGLSEALAKAGEKGLRESLELGGEILRARFARRSRNGRKAFLFLSPPLNNSGAPLVLMKVVEEFADQYGSASVRLLAPPQLHEPRGRATVGGVKVERAAEVLGPTPVRLQLALRDDDFVLMNTVAVSRNYLDVILDLVETRKLAHAYWYIHEDVDQLPVHAPFLLEPDARAAIGRLMEQGQLTIVVPSRRVKAEYDELFGNVNTRVLPFKLAPDTHHISPRPVDDYSSVRFLMSGKPTDGRKGHVVALAAFHEFMNTYYEFNPDAYRSFTLTLVGMTDDFISKQIRSVGATVLGERLRTFAAVSHERSLEITGDCNAVVCCSFNEALPLYVIEGMCSGHVVLRNEGGGMEEQLEDGVNGFLIDSTDVRQVARILERVLNKTTTTDTELQTMGRASQERVAGLLIPSYVEALEQARIATPVT